MSSVSPSITSPSTTSPSTTRCPPWSLAPCRRTKSCRPLSKAPAAPRSPTNGETISERRRAMARIRGRRIQRVGGSNDRMPSTDVTRPGTSKRPTPAAPSVLSATTPPAARSPRLTWPMPSSSPAPSRPAASQRPARARGCKDGDPFRRPNRPQPDQSTDTAWTPGDQARGTVGTGQPQRDMLLIGRSETPWARSVWGNHCQPPASALVKNHHVFV